MNVCKMPLFHIAFHRFSSCKRPLSAFKEVLSRKLPIVLVGREFCLTLSISKPTNCEGMKKKKEKDKRLSPIQYP